MSSVLIVEDEVILLAVIERFLRPYFCRTFTANNPTDAIIIAQKHQPSLLITDYNLSTSLTGLDLCLAFVQNPQLNQTRRVMMSGQIESRAGLEHLIELLIPKPFTGDELLTALSPLLPARPPSCIS